jgi:hypothetical protein
VIATARRPLAVGLRSWLVETVGSRVRWAPLVVLSSGFGLLAIGLADDESRRGGDLALPLYWLGMLALFGPITWWLLAPTTWARPRRVRHLAALPLTAPTGAIGDALEGRAVVVEGRLERAPRRSGRGLRFDMDDGSGPVAVSVAAAALRGVRLRAGSHVRVSGSVRRRRGRIRRGGSGRGVDIRAALGSDVVLLDIAGDGLRAAAGDHVSRQQALSSRSRPAWVGAVRRGPGREERLGLVLGLGVALYVVRVMTSPIAFSGPDEFSHWRTLEDIVRTGHLFSPNPLLQVSSIYPGLEAAAATATVSSGVDVVPVALLLIGLARLVAVLAIFLLAARIAASARVAGVAAIIYMANPSFLAFDAAFSYESLALPLALVAIWATLRWSDRGGRAPLYATVALGSIAATAVTHHLTSLVLLAFLTVWAVIALVRRSGARSSGPVAAAAAFALLCSAAWLGIAGTFALTYLSTILGGGLRQLLEVLAGAGEAKQLFVARAGFTSPLPEIGAAYGAVGLLVLSLPFVLWHALRTHRPSPIELVLVLGALAYPATLALRLTAAGSEASQRASEFLFVALAILGADWLVGLRPSRFRPPRPMAAAAILLIVGGGIVTGNPLIGRLPGPYHVAAESRSFEPEGRSLAVWALAHLGPDNNLIADRTNAKLLGSIGLENPVMSANSHLGTAYVMYARTLGPNLIDILRQGRIRYVVVDLRLAEDVPVYAYVFEQAEPGAGSHTAPMPLAALQKWDGLPGVHRIYDSGDLIVYDIQGYLDAGA